MTLRAEIFPKLRTPKNMLSSISTRSRFWWSFRKIHSKRTKTLFQFQWQHIYHIYWSLWRQLTCKRSLLVIRKILNLFPNTLSANGKYFPLNGDNLTQQTQIQLSGQKKKNFLNFFSPFLKSSLDFALFQIKCDSHSSDICEITDSEKHGLINF